MNKSAAPAPFEPTVVERKALALQRLDASRTALIQRLFPANDDATPGQRDDASGSGLPQMLALLTGRMQRDGWLKGGWRALRAVSRRWWKQQPWHTSVDLVAGTVAREAKPLVQSHPWAFMAGAAALGAALVWARPWVSRTVRQHTQGMHRHLGGMLWHQLAQAPVQLALAGALSTWLTNLVRKAPAMPAKPATEATPNATQAAAGPRPDLMR